MPLLILVLVCACGEPGPQTTSETTAQDTVRWEAAAEAETAAVHLVPVTGYAYDFVKGWTSHVAGGSVTCTQRPDLETTTDEEGRWLLEGFVPGEIVGFRFSHSDYALIQTGNLEVGLQGIEEVRFQAPHLDMFSFVQGLLGVVPDPERCQMATTVTTLPDPETGYGPTHGEAGATVTISPPLDEAALGPVYWRVLPNYWIVPDFELTETTEDGGVLFVNVLPGEYTLEAHKAGAEFSIVKVTCSSGLLVNAAPPHALQLQ